MKWTSRPEKDLNKESSARLKCFIDLIPDVVDAMFFLLTCELRYVASQVKLNSLINIQCAEG